MKAIFYTLFVAALLFSCSEDESLAWSEECSCYVPFETDIQKIRYGTSFGFCLGYCNHELNVTAGNINYSAYSVRDNVTYPDIDCHAINENWVDLISLIDEQGFVQLDEIIGCPDCADGGAEWVEITDSGGSKQVTFEYNKAPATLDSLVKVLRLSIVSFDDCN